MNNQNPEPTTQLAMKLLQDGKIDECIACATRLVEADSNNAHAFSILGAAYARAGMTGMAIASFEQALEVEPSPRAHYNLGAAYEQSGRIEDAIEQFRSAVRMDPAYRYAADALKRLTGE